GHLDAPLEPLGSGHRDRAHPPIPEVLLHFKGQPDRVILYPVVNGQGVVDRGERVGEFDVHDGTGHLYDFADVHDACPPAISSSSVVMAACRILFDSSVSSRMSDSALSVAFFIDTSRALCSLAFACSRTKYSEILR